MMDIYTSLIPLRSGRKNPMLHAVSPCRWSGEGLDQQSLGRCEPQGRLVQAPWDVVG